MPSPFATLSELRAALDGGEVTSAQLVEASLGRAEATQGSLNAFVRLRPEDARAAAAQADARLASGACRSALDGIPVAIKDVMVHEGEVTTCASHILEGFVSPYSATAVEKLEAAGAVIVGRTNMDEFAMGSSTEHSRYGPTHNPWNLACTAGGSSGGSAARNLCVRIMVPRGMDLTLLISFSLHINSVLPPPRSKITKGLS